MYKRFLALTSLTCGIFAGSLAWSAEVQDFGGHSREWSSNTSWEALYAHALAQDRYETERQIQECRALLSSLTNGNAKVLKMYDETVSMWLKHQETKDINFNLPILLKAITFAADKHQGQFRKDKEATPYIIHPIGVARSLWEEGKVRSLNVLLAALLHDTLEDTNTTADEIEKEFGPRVRMTVEELTDDPNLSDSDNKQRQVKHAPEMSHDAQLVKLADRLYNVRDLKNLPADWSRDRINGYLLWGEKLLEALKGTSDQLEHLLQDELDAQLPPKVLN